jgi:hypothetical protein
MNINHTKAAKGIFIIRVEPKTTNSIKNIEDDIHDNLFLQPFDILIIDCPIIAQPHIAQKKPQVIFAIPCQTASLFAFHLVSVSSSINVNVIKDSVKPITANIKLYGIIILRTLKKSSVINGI